MNTRNRNKLMMYRMVMQACDRPENAPIWQTLPAFVTTFDNFTTNVAKLEGLAQPDDIPGKTRLKQQKRDEIAMEAYQIANSIHAYGAEIKNPELQSRVDFTLYKLTHGRDLVLIGHFRQIVAAAHDHVAQLAPHKVTPERIAAFEGMLENFEQSAQGPQATKQLRKMKNAEIATLVKTIDSILNDRLDRLASNFALSHAAFYTLYRNARVVIDIRATRTPADAGESDATSAGASAGASASASEGASEPAAG